MIPAIQTQIFPDADGVIQLHERYGALRPCVDEVAEKEHSSSKVYTISDFEELGSPEAIKATLDELATLMPSFSCIGDRLYHRARWVKLMSCWGAAHVDEVVKVIMQRDGRKLLLISGDCANRLHFTTSVVCCVVYLTDGPSRIEEAGGWKIDFQHAEPDVMFWADHPGGMVIQALRWMGEDWLKAHESGTVIRLRSHTWRGNKLPEPIRDDLRENMEHVPNWMRPCLERVIA
jgi:hypothetical protein